MKVKNQELETMPLNLLIQNIIQRVTFVTINNPSAEPVTTESPIAVCFVAQN